MPLVKLLMPLGLVADAIIVFAALIGLRWIKISPRRHLKTHRLVSLIGIGIALLHGALGLYVILQ